MASETVEFIASFVIIVTVIAGGIINSTQSISNAFNYDIDQASSSKAKDILMGILEHTGSPSDWAITDDKPSVFGLRWPSSSSATPSPFGISRMLERSATISYGGNDYYELSRDDFNLYLNKDICLEYKELKTLIDPNLRYGLQLTFKPVLKISTDLQASNLKISVWGPSGPVTGANVTISVFDITMVDPNPMEIKRLDMPSVSTITGDCSFDLSGFNSPFFVYIRANYGSISSAGYYSSVNLEPAAIIPILTNYEAAEVSLVHRRDVSLYSNYTYSGGVVYNSTFLIPLEEDILQSTQPTSGTILYEKPPPTESLINFKQTPGILLIFYERLDPEDYGLVAMPWGINSLGVETTFGPEPDHVVNVVTQNAVSNIGGVTYNTEIKLWRDIITTETVSGIFNVTVTSNPSGVEYVIVDGAPITTPHTFQWVMGDTHTVQANSLVNAGSKTQHQFIGWSDGGTQIHEYTVSSSSTLIANYKAQHQVSFETDPIGGGTTTPSASQYYDDGEKIIITANPNPNYGFLSWLSSNSSTTFSIQEITSVATIGGPTTIKANFIFGVISVTITSDPIGDGFVEVDGKTITTPKTFNWISGENHQLAANSPVPVDDETRYAYSSWSDGGAQAHSYIVGAVETITASFNTQYKASFTASNLDGTINGSVVEVDGTPISSLPYSKWYTSGSLLSYNYSNPITSSDVGKQFKLSHVAGPVTGSTITSPITIVGTYITQYQVSFSVNPIGYGTTDPSGTGIWVDEGTLPISSTASMGHIFSTWERTGSIIITGPLSPTTTATISGSGTITAVFANGPVEVWIKSNPSGSGFVWVDGIPVTTPVKYNWEVGSTHSLIAGDEIPGATGTRYVFSGWSDGGDKSHQYYVSTVANITANFKTQYYWRFMVNGLDGDVNTGFTIVSAGGVTIPHSSLPYTDWFDHGTTYTYSSIVDSNITGKRFSLVSSSTPTPPSGGDTWYTVIGTYKTQYLLKITTNGLPSGKTTKIYINGNQATDDYGVSQIDDTSINGWRKWIDTPIPTGTIGVDAINSGYKFKRWSDSTTNNPHSTVLMDQPRTYIVYYEK